MFYRPIQVTSVGHPPRGGESKPTGSLTRATNDSCITAAALRHSSTYPSRTGGAAAVLAPDANDAPVAARFRTALARVTSRLTPFTSRFGRSFGRYAVSMFFLACASLLAGATRRAPEHFRVVHFSVQWDHVHLIVEASDERALSRGVRASPSALRAL